MFPYIIVCLITLLFAHFADSNYGRSAVKTIIPLVCIVILNTVFAGARDFGVGIDTTVYIQLYYDSAKYLSFQDFIVNEEGWDRGFLLLSLLATKISKDAQSLMFIVELFIIGITTAGAYNAKKSLNFTFVSFYLVFFLLLYADSLNLMRQFCAMALLFYGYSWLLKEKWRIALIFHIIAYFFHTSSLCFLLVPITYSISILEGKKKYYYAVFAFVAVLIAMGSYYFILAQLGDMGLYTDVYNERYGESSKYESENSFSWVLLTHWRYVIPLVLPIIVIISGKIKKMFSEQEFYMGIVITSFAIIISQAQFIMVYFGRFSYYFIYIYILYISMVISSQKTYKLLNVFYIIFFTYMWYYNNIYVTQKLLGWSFEYSSKILGI